MEKIDWDEYVDAYVDGELADEERRQVEERAETNLEFREQLEWTTALHKRFASLRTTVPEGFADRLLNAIHHSPAWDAIESADKPLVAEVARRSERSSFRRRFVPVAVAVCAIVAISEVSFVGFNKLRVPATVEGNSQLAVNEQGVEERDSSDFNTAETRPLIMTPSPAGNAPTSVVKRRSPTGFWSTVSFEDVRLKRRIREFQRLCDKQGGLKFKKVKSDLEFELANVKPTDWRVVAVWIEETADAYEFSEALQAWSAKEDDKVKPRSLRVSFSSTVHEIDAEEASSSGE